MSILLDAKKQNVQVGADFKSMKLTKVHQNLFCHFLHGGQKKTETCKILMTLVDKSCTAREGFKVYLNLHEYFRPQGRIKHWQKSQYTINKINEFDKTFTFSQLLPSSTRLKTGTWSIGNLDRQSTAHEKTPEEVVCKQKDFVENLTPPSSPRLLQPGFHLPRPPCWLAGWRRAGETSNLGN